ncbi:MAG: HNH endonuclease signature motif containing protein [Patescibacteria group bacterium]|nr:HNH endonuclease signature motif containing protein [Patescibacteria group bacterium]
MNFAELDHLHKHYKMVAVRYRKTQGELLDCTQKADEEKLYLYKGYKSLFDYLVRDLGLSESTTCDIINVARTAKIVPQLKEQLEQGQSGISKLRKICPVLKKAYAENKPEEIAEWLKKTVTMCTREIEKEVAKVSPAPRRKESIRRINENTSSLNINLSDEERELLKKAQNLSSSKNKSCQNMTETIVQALQEFVEKHDPVKKAERQKERQQKKESAAQTAELQSVTDDSKEAESIIETDGKKNESVTSFYPEEDKTESVTNDKSETEKTGRQSISATIVHEVNRRDGGQCTYVSPDGRRCECNRFLHFHHVKPVAHGGENTVENLITLCSAHHRLLHENEKSKKYFPQRK